MTGKVGNPTGANQYGGGIVSNVNNSTERTAGNTTTYALRKLRKDAPELLLPWPSSWALSMGGRLCNALHNPGHHHMRLAALWNVAYLCFRLKCR